MRKIRALCFVLALGLLTFNQLVVRAEAEACWCPALQIFCDGFCHEHGGTAMIDCHVGSGCQEVCFCNDNEIYAGDTNYCPPCNE